MKIHFIFPRWKRILDDDPDIQATVSGQEIGTFRMAGLGIPTAAASIPLEHEVTLADDNLGDVDTAVTADLICISFFTPQATRAYALADSFRRRGIPVLGGGIHPTTAPDDTLAHFDSIVQGPAEGLWPEILDDLRRGRLKPRYRGTGDQPFLQPRRELFRSSSYLRAGIVQTARGCDHGCGFCIIPGCYGGTIRMKPVADVVEDIRRVPFFCYYFADENLLFADDANRAYRHELMSRLREERIPKFFFLAAYPFMLKGLGDDDAKLLSEAGCRQIYLILGLYAPLARELRDEALRSKIRELKKLDIEMMATFTLGHDGGTPGEEEGLIEAFCREEDINLAEFTLWTPFPGTEAFARLEREGRLLSRPWEEFNGAHVVFQPRNETPEALRMRFVRLWRKFYEDIDSFGVNRRYAKGFGTSVFERK